MSGQQHRVGGKARYAVFIKYRDLVVKEFVSYQKENCGFEIADGTRLHSYIEFLNYFILMKLGITEVRGTVF